MQYSTDFPSASIDRDEWQAINNIHREGTAQAPRTKIYGTGHDVVEGCGGGPRNVINMLSLYGAEPEKSDNDFGRRTVISINYELERLVKCKR